MIYALEACIPWRLGVECCSVCCDSRHVWAAGRYEQRYRLRSWPYAAWYLVCHSWRAADGPSFADRCPARCVYCSFQFRLLTVSARPATVQGACSRLFLCIRHRNFRCRRHTVFGCVRLWVCASRKPCDWTLHCVRKKSNPLNNVR